MSASAQDDPSVERVEMPDIGAMIDRAARRAGRNDISGALTAFKEVLTYEVDPDVVWNIGNLSEHADIWFDCAMYFRWYLVLDPEDPEAPTIRRSIERCEGHFDHPGALTVVVAPSEGARVSVNGFPLGLGGLDALPLPAGTYQVEATAFDHVPFSGEVEVTEGEPTVTEVSLETIIYYGDITIEVSDPGATVSVDGEVIGTAPLSETIHRPEGSYLVEVTLDGFHPWRRFVDVVRDDNSLQRVRLIDVDMPLEDL